MSLHAYEINQLLTQCFSDKRPRLPIVLQRAKVLGQTCDLVEKQVADTQVLVRENNVRSYGYMGPVPIKNGRLCYAQIKQDMVVLGCEVGDYLGCFQTNEVSGAAGIEVCTGRSLVKMQPSVGVQLIQHQM